MKSRRLKQRAWKHRPNSGAQVQACGLEQWDVTPAERHSASRMSGCRAYPGARPDIAKKPSHSGVGLGYSRREKAMLYDKIRIQAP